MRSQPPAAPEGAPSGQGQATHTPLTLHSVNVSDERARAKVPVGRATVDRQGLVGDSQAGPWHRQVSALSFEALQVLAQQVGEQIDPGVLAENLTIGGLDFRAVAPLDQLLFGDVQLEVTELRESSPPEGFHVSRRSEGGTRVPLVFCRVLAGGVLEPGAPGHLVQRPLRVRIITLSDRAYRGDYSDRSGPRVQELIQAALAPRPWHLECERVLLSDELEPLLSALQAARGEGVDAVFTTGGTGVGSRDRSPEAVTSVCDRLLPGIMDFIRIKFGASNPRALLSRSVAGVADKTLVYALPGSVRAVEEYVPEILKTFEHLLLALRDIDAH